MDENGRSLNQGRFESSKIDGVELIHNQYRHSVNFISRLSTIGQTVSRLSRLSRDCPLSQSVQRFATSCLMDDLFIMTVYFQIVQLSPHGRFNLTVLFKLDKIIKFMVHHETDRRTLTSFLDLPFGLRLGRSLSLEMSHNCTIRSRL